MEFKKGDKAVWVLLTPFTDARSQHVVVEFEKHNEGGTFYGTVIASTYPNYPVGWKGGNEGEFNITAVKKITKEEFKIITNG